ncbi:hypothetical protein M427DRAFT_189378 [Gonapodya prolifera JEL478]|uniref:Uncharacterized protein n=1 Tax=Gonapodya prolifera (strain JEL478) TaxID=1344416 RepID=A0A139A067_GONPJ|nr:hypothetical protein M427DRAFT_189378 [Gonapodya prolifera JEL478]|eukprot:KXS10176.1 hypothetical protein M427DRAFT_189378 [Gonapodya prolifera JEL478]
MSAIVGGGVNQEERRRLTNQIIGHIKTRLCQTTSSFSQLSSRVVGAFGAAVKSFGLQPKTAANVLFILELPSETVRADIFWGLPVDEDFRASIARETYLWWRDSGSWQQKAMAFIVFARELVSPRGADTLQRIKLPGTSHAAIIAYVASGRTHIAAGRLSPIALSPFLAPIYKLPASTEEGAINSLAAMETDMQNIQFFLRSITTDSGVREFAGSVWAELLTLNLISPMVLGKALALKQRFYYVGGHFSALAKAEFVMPPRKVDRRKDVEAQEHRKIERRMVREVLKVFWMTVAQDKSIDSTLASTRIQNAISAVSLNQGELVSAAAAICPEHRGEQWAFMKSIVGSVGGASALRELWDLVLKMEKATIEKAKMSGVESRSELADDRDDVVKGTKSEMNSRGTRQQRRREKEMEDLEDGSDSSDITGDERDTKSNERRQKKGRKEAAKMSKERGRARDDKWQS